MATLLERIARIHKQYGNPNELTIAGSIDAKFIEKMVSDELFCAFVGDVFLHAVYRKMREHDLLTGLLKGHAEKPSEEAIRIRQRLCMERIEKNYSDSHEVSQLYSSGDIHPENRLRPLLEQIASSETLENTHEHDLKRLVLTYRRTISSNPDKTPEQEISDAKEFMASIGRAVIKGSREHYREKMHEAPLLENYKRFLEYRRIEKRLRK